ncbi:MAG: acetyl-CoA carboxylase biotin carboxyl carrier protein [Vampirovibrionales bacterium]|nr:acetyl-CoA carboxylase biotin carboxyl carrier protein [Vampirovibrionales bacterium]
MNFDIEKIRTLADLAIEKNLAEITVADGDKSVTVKLPVASSVVTAAPQVVASAAAAPQVAASVKTSEQAAGDDNYFKVTSPMVGTFYASPAPDAPAYASVGSSVAKGQTLCILEAMKMMNELESEVSGKVVKILVENGKPVEYGQVIMLIDTK